MADPTNSGFWAWLASEPGKAALAGAAGGLVRWITLRDSWWEGLAGIAAGSVCAVFLGPMVLPVLEPVLGGISDSGEHITGFTSFVVGLGGIGLASALIDILQSWRQGGPKGPRRDPSDGGGDAQS
jgi:hypothetical protein